MACSLGFKSKRSIALPVEDTRSPSCALRVRKVIQTSPIGTMAEPAAWKKGLSSVDVVTPWWKESTSNPSAAGFPVGETKKRHTTIRQSTLMNECRDKGLHRGQESQRGRQVLTKPVARPSSMTVSQQSLCHSSDGFLPRLVAVSGRATPLL